MSQSSIILTADGVETLGSLPGGEREVTFLAAGSFGGGTLTFGYLDVVDGTTFRPFGTAASSPTLTANGGSAVSSPPGVTYAVSLAGATAPSISVVAG